METSSSDGRSHIYNHLSFRIINQSMQYCYQITIWATTIRKRKSNVYGQHSPKINWKFCRQILRWTAIQMARIWNGLRSMPVWVNGWHRCGFKMHGHDRKNIRIMAKEKVCKAFNFCKPFFSDQTNYFLYSTLRNKRAFADKRIAIAPPVKLWSWLGIIRMTAHTSNTIWNSAEPKTQIFFFFFYISSNRIEVLYET